MVHCRMAAHYGKPYESMSHIRMQHLHHNQYTLHESQVCNFYKLHNFVLQ